MFFIFVCTLIAMNQHKGWIRFGNSLFLIINVPTLKRSDARRTCQMLGGDLPILRSAAENTFIFDLVKKQKTVTDFGVWLGFVRKADNKFYWIGDTPLKGSYAPWGRGEPNQISEKCGNIFGKRPPVGKWNDLYCSLSVNDLKYAPSILCQKKANWFCSILSFFFCWRCFLFLRETVKMK